MDNIKEIVAKNITHFRNTLHLTQLELGEKLNYSDKAISRWERGEAIPDAKVLIQLSELFGVTVDDILKQPCVKHKNILSNQKSKNHKMIASISVIAVWTAALLTFVVMYLCSNPQWLVFVYALPASIIVALVFNSMWGSMRKNMYIISALMWSVLLSVYLSALSYNWWIVFLLGIPAQVIICLCFGIRKKGIKH